MTDTTPEKRSQSERLPLDGEIKAVFDDVFGYETIGRIDDPHMRSRFVTAELLPRYEELTTKLHALMSQTHIEARPHDEQDGLLNHDSLDLHADVVRSVLPEVNVLLQGMGAYGLSVEGRLQRMAAVVGTVISQSRSFGGADDRVARAVHDYIRDGRQGLSAVRIFNDERDFTPPLVAENMIMLQSVTRLINGTSARYGDHPGGSAVSSPVIPETIKSRFEATTVLFDHLRSVSERPSAESVATKLAPYVLASSELQLGEVLRVLRQEQYGPAAWMAAFKAGPVGLPVGGAELVHLQKTNRVLLSMRIMGLARGVARGGLFEAQLVGDTPENNKTYRTNWAPNAAFL